MCFSIKSKLIDILSKNKLLTWKVGRGEFLAGMYLQLQLLNDSFGLQMYSIIYASLIFVVP